MNNQFKIDVIVPVYKPDEKFMYLMDKLMDQTLVPNHIILMHTVPKLELNNMHKLDDFINWEKAKKANIDVVIHNIEKKDFDHGGTRNKGASLSSSDICVFMTQDAIPADNLMIEELIKGLLPKEVASVYGRQLPHAGAGILERYSRTFNYPKESSYKSKEDIKKLGIKTYFCSNVCAAYKMEVYHKLGGFVTKTIFNEDMIMAYHVIQNGYKIGYCADAKVFHSHTYTFMEQLKRNFDLAVSQVEYDYIFSSVKSETEGIKFVKKTIHFLIEQKRAVLIPTFIIESAFKFIGYKLGKNYKKLPMVLIKKISMNPAYWENKKA